MRTGESASRQQPPSLSRRLLLAAIAAQPALQPALPALAVPPLLRDTVRQTLAVPDGTAVPLELAQRPAYALESEDVFYPEFFLGQWRVSSKLAGVVAPAGEMLFAPGRNGTEALRRARLDPPLYYDVRWVRNPSGKVVVDRAYNVASISRAALGDRAVQDVSAAGPDLQSLILSPSGAPRAAVYRADLKVTARHTDEPPAGSTDFDCAELVRQTVTLVPGEAAPNASPPPPSVKEVETICVYSLAADGSITGQQRTATFLVPDASYTAASSLVEQQAARLTRTKSGRMIAIDVRTFDLTFTKSG